MPSRLADYALLLAVAAALTLPNLGASSLWDVDEGVNAEAAREMHEAGTWVIPTFNFELRTAKPVIMAVNGIAAGGGMSLALAGDLVVAAESAKFTMAYSRIAASPDGSSSYFLPRMIGLRRALELHYTNRVLSAREAMDWGLVNRVHPDAEFPSAVSALAKELAQGPTLAFGRAKLLFHQSTQESLETQMELEAQAIAASGHTEDFKNGVAAFAKKQPPTFHGR